MIQRQWRKAELFRETSETGRDFGADCQPEKVADIDVVLTEARTNQTTSTINRAALNEIDVVIYDMVALTRYTGNIAKAMCLLCDDIRYDVKYVSNSRRFRQIFLKRVE